MKVLASITAILLLFGTSQIMATISSDELLKRCKGEAPYINKVDGGKSYCIGYVAGFLDTYMLAIALHDIKPKTKYFCLPKEGISLKRAKQVADIYLENHPNQLHRAARVLLIKAFAQAYPCSQ